MAKHIIFLYDMCFDDDTDYDISIWNEKITDSLNYLFLLKVIVKEEHRNQPNGSKNIELSDGCRKLKKHGLYSVFSPANEITDVSAVISKGMAGGSTKGNHFLERV